MSLFFAGGVAFAYAVGVVGMHRVAVARRRALAQGYPTLRWLDWDTLLAGVLPPAPRLEGAGPAPREGGPPPRLLCRAPGNPAHEWLEALVRGDDGLATPPEGLGPGGGAARWLGLLAGVRREPRRVLAQLSSTPPSTVAEAYLREWLALEHDVTTLNLELATAASRRRSSRALRRFGEHPSLYFARARASSLMGLTDAVLDDLARAVYFSRKAPFFLLAVTELPFVEEARPALARACREALGPRD